MFRIRKKALHFYMWHMGFEQVQESQTKLVTDGFFPDSETTEFEIAIKSIKIKHIAFVQICRGSNESTDN